MKRFPIGFIITLILVTVALAALVFAPKPQSRPDATALEISYIVSVREITTEYLALQNQVAAKTAEGKLLNLTVPSDHRDFHLDLVLALHKFSGVKIGDVKALTGAKQKIQGIIDGAEWLK